MAHSRFRQQVEAHTVRNMDVLRLEFMKNHPIALPDEIDNLIFRARDRFINKYIEKYSDQDLEEMILIFIDSEMCANGTR